MSVLAFAEAFVALANSKKSVTLSASTTRKALDALSQKHQKTIASYWESANQDALRLLVVVMKNNPKKTAAQILSRADVQEVLRAPYEEAAKKSEDLLKQAWSEAEALSVKHAKAEFGLIGAEWVDHATDTALLDALVKDLHSNAKAMRSRYTEAMKDTSNAKARMEGTAADSIRRARYSLQQAVWGVASQVKDTAAENAGLNKMWVAVMDGNTCSHCKALHGMVIGPGEQFPHDAGDTTLATYKGTLFGPPRHPNCRCVLVATKQKKTKLGI